MADGQHKLSRRALLGAVCAAPSLSAIPEGTPSKYYFDGNPEAGTSGRPAPSPARWDPGFRRDDGRWDRALVSLRQAQTILDAAKSEPDQDRYDALLDSHTEALTALLALPAPDLAGMAAKLDAIIPHQAWENTGSEDCLERLRQDAHRLAASAA